MSNIEEEDDGGGIPEWVVTFGDMMSLLLTFFIMLVSLSEIKQEEKFQALVESFRKQFGHEATMKSIVPGTSKPRNSDLAKLATLGRARRYDIMRGGNKVEAPVGDYSNVRIVRPGSRTAIGTVLTFEEGSAELTEEHRRDLQLQIGIIGGKPQKIEVRGHTSRRPVPPGGSFADNWELAYARARKVTEFLTEMGIEPGRIRISVAGPYEPFHLGTDPLKLKLNPRVDVFLLEEVVEDLQGTADELQQRFVDEAPQKDE